MRFDDLAVDHEAIEAGTWRPAAGLPGCRFKLRGADNLDWRRLAAKLQTELPREKQLAATLDPVDDDAMMAQLLLKACLQDWDGFEGADGKPEPFTAERAAEIVTDPKFKRVRSSILATARILANETIAEREAAAKN